VLPTPPCTLRPERKKKKKKTKKKKKKKKNKKIRTTEACRSPKTDRFSHQYRSPTKLSKVLVAQNKQDSTAEKEKKKKKKKKKKLLFVCDAQRWERQRQC
jgi:hypothetical protein